MNLQETIKSIQNELDNNSINKQRQRYLESHLIELIEYSVRNPDVTKLPGPLTIYCDLNPNAKECKIFDL